MQTYRIPSATTPGKSYTVTIHPDGVMSCDCPDAVYRKRQCKHQRQVLVLWTAAGRSGALVEAAKTEATVAHERALEKAEAAGATLGAIFQERHGWLTAVECMCGYHCDRASSLEHHITIRNGAVHS